MAATPFEVCGNHGPAHTARKACALRGQDLWARIAAGICVILLLVPLWGDSARAAVPDAMTFQGVLTVDEEPFTGAASVSLAIFEEASGGAAIWTQDAGEVLIDQGLYSVTLTSLASLAFDKLYWLEVTVDGAALSPRYPLLSVPYALRAATAEGVADGAIDGAAVADGSLTAADLATDIVSSISGVAHDGGDIALVAGENIVITPDAGAHRITIAAVDETGGDITDVFAGPGLTATDPAGPRVTLAVNAGEGLSLNDGTLTLASSYLAGSAFDLRFVNEDQAGSITTSMIVPAILSSLSGVSNDGGNVTLLAGPNVTITPDHTAKTITIASSHEGGDVTDVLGGPGLVTTNAAGPQVTLAVGAGDGIRVSDGEVSVSAGDGLTLSEGRVELGAEYLSGSIHDARFVNEAQAGAISLEMIAPPLLGSLDGVSHHGGDIDLVAGANVTITPSDLAHTITIAALGDVTDVLAGAGLAVTDGGGPQPSLAIVPGDGLFIDDEGLHIETPDLVGAGLIHDGANNLAVDPGDGILIDEDGVHVQVADLVGAGMVHDGGNNLAVDPADGIRIDEEGVHVQASDLIGAGMVHDGANNLAVDPGDGIHIDEEGVHVQVSDLVGDGLTHDGANNLAVNPAIGLEIAEGGALQLTTAYSSGSAYDSRFVNEGGPGTIPVGGIIMWSGGSVPSGWALCNGQTVNGHTTPNLCDRFVVAAGSGYSIGSTGGESTHTLTIDEMPAHTHNYWDYYHPMEYADESDSDDVANWELTQAYRTSESTGGSLPHNNMPPYYALAFIMRTQ